MKKLKKMPRPLENENREDFLNRCMSDNEANTDFPDNDQRFAFCVAQWNLNEKIDKKKALIKTKQIIKK